MSAPLLILGWSSLARRHLVRAATTSGCFDGIEVASLSASPQTVDDDRVTKVHDHYANALETSSAETVYISLVNSEHAVWARQSIESGRHTIVDKPLALSLDETSELEALSRKAEVALVESTVWSFHPQVTRITEIFEQNKPTRVVVQFSMPPFADDNFRWQKKLGGGALHDLGPYAASAARIFCETPPDTLDAQVHAVKDQVPVSFSLLATWADGRSLSGHFGFDTEYINHIDLLAPGVRVSCARIFTTPHDFENQLQVSLSNTDASETIQAADAFGTFFTQVMQSIDNGSAQAWRDAFLADATFRNRLNLACQEA